MENKEILEVNQTPENVEQTTEQTPKMFTQDEVNEIVGKSKARERAKIIKQYDKKYGELEEVLKTGMGKETIEEITPALKDFYKGKGVKFSEKPAYSAKDIEILARAEADEFIRSGYEDVVEETDRLADIGVANMNPREKALFKVLAEHRQNTEKSRELSKLGVSEDIYNSKEFIEFAAQFNSNTPVKNIYDIYSKYNPKKEYKTMGSMKNTSQGNEVKEFYTPEEARKFTKNDFDKNPALFKAVENSMLKWKR